MARQPRVTRSVLLNTRATPSRLQPPTLRSCAHSLLTLFTHNGQSETIYSTTTVDVRKTGTTTVDYWAVVPTTQQVLHTTRTIVVAGAANDNQASTPVVATSSSPAATSTQLSASNDNTPLPVLSATGTEARSTAP